MPVPRDAALADDFDVPPLSAGRFPAVTFAGGAATAATLFSLARIDVVMDCFPPFFPFLPFRGAVRSCATKSPSLCGGGAGAGAACLVDTARAVVVVFTTVDLIGHDGLAACFFNRMTPGVLCPKDGKSFADGRPRLADAVVDGGPFGGAPEVAS